jgi:hypothetical protein
LGAKKNAEININALIQKKSPSELPSGEGYTHQGASSKRRSTFGQAFPKSLLTKSFIKGGMSF